MTEKIKKERSIGTKAMPKVCCAQMLKLGGNIRLARARRKIRQEDMAKRIAISVKTYRKIEAGDPTVARRGTPSRFHRIYH